MKNIFYSGKVKIKTIEGGLIIRSTTIILQISKAPSAHEDNRGYEYMLYTYIYEKI